MWIPYFSDGKLRALEIEEEHHKNLLAGMKSKQSAKTLAGRFYLSTRSIYRHIQYAKSVRK